MQTKNQKDRKWVEEINAKICKRATKTSRSIKNTRGQSDAENIERKQERTTYFTKIML